MLKAAHIAWPPQGQPCPCPRGQRSTWERMFPNSLPQQQQWEQQVEQQQWEPSLGPAEQQVEQQVEQHSRAKWEPSLRPAEWDQQQWERHEWEQMQGGYGQQQQLWEQDEATSSANSPLEKIDKAMSLGFVLVFRNCLEAFCLQELSSGVVFGGNKYPTLNI